MDSWTIEKKSIWLLSPRPLVYTFENRELDDLEAWRGLEGLVRCREGCKSLSFLSKGSQNLNRLRPSEQNYGHLFQSAMATRCLVSVFVERSSRGALLEKRNGKGE